jgi:hypothetical protein
VPVIVLQDYQISLQDTFLSYYAMVV